MGIVWENTTSSTELPICPLHFISTDFYFLSCLSFFYTLEPLSSVTLNSGTFIPMKDLENQWNSLMCYMSHINVILILSSTQFFSEMWYLGWDIIRTYEKKRKIIKELFMDSLCTSFLPSSLYTDVPDASGEHKTVVKLTFGVSPATFLDQGSWSEKN